MFYTNGTDTYCGKPRESKIAFTCGEELKFTGLTSASCLYTLTAEISCLCPGKIL